MQRTLNYFFTPMESSSKLFMTFSSPSCPSNLWFTQEIEGRYYAVFRFLNCPITLFPQLASRFSTHFCPTCNSHALRPQCLESRLRAQHWLAGPGRLNDKVWGGGRAGLTAVQSAQVALKNASCIREKRGLSGVAGQFSKNWILRLKNVDAIFHNI